MDVSDVGAAPQMPSPEVPDTPPADAGTAGGDVGPVGGATDATGASGASSADASPAGGSPSSSGPTEVQRQLQQDSFSPAADQRGPGASRADTQQADARREDVRRQDLQSRQQRDTFEASARTPTQTRPELNPNAGPRPTPPAAAPRQPTQTKPELNPNAGPRPTPPAAAPRQPTQLRTELPRSSESRSQEDAPETRRAQDQRVQPPPARAATVRPQAPGGPTRPGPTGGVDPHEVRSATPRADAFHSGFAGVDRGRISATTQAPEAYRGRGAATTQETRVRNGDSASTFQESHGTRRNGQRDSAPTVQRSDAPEGHIRTSGAVRTTLLNPADANATLAGAQRTNVPLLNDPASGVAAEAHYQGPAINVTGNAHINWTGSNYRPGMDLHVDAKIDANVVSGGGSVTQDFHFNNGGHDYTVRVRMATDGQVGMNGTLKLDMHAGLDRGPSFSVGAEGFAGVQGKLTGGVQVFMDGDMKNPMMQGDLSVMLGAGVGGSYQLEVTPNTFHTRAYAYAGVGVGVDMNATVDWVKLSNTTLPRGTVMPFDSNARWWGPLHQLQWWQAN